MSTVTNERLFIPQTLREALDLLAEDSAITPIAGGTWLMRAPLRGEPLPGRCLAIGAIDELAGVQIEEATVTIGAGVSHAALARAVDGVPDLRGLGQAAMKSANPAIREVATVGGNLATGGFPAADLVPALLAMDAEVIVAHRDREERVPMTRFLEREPRVPPGSLLTGVRVARRRQSSGHARLTMRTAGDYAVAIVSLCLGLQEGGTITEARVAVGSVEPTPRRWTELEQALAGSRADAATAAQAADSLVAGFNGRDGVEAPGWYRTRVLPTLVRRAFEAALPRTA